MTLPVIRWKSLFNHFFHTVVPTKMTLLQDDPNYPKRPPNAYILYHQSRHMRIKKANPTMKTNEVVSAYFPARPSLKMERISFYSAFVCCRTKLAKTSADWKALGDNKKQRYKDAAGELLQEYKNAVEAYNRSKKGDEDTNQGG